MVKISYLEITGRGDYPIVNRPDLHLWEPTLQTLAKQTFKDFEYIPIDVFWQERRDYFKEHNYGLRIKHIPASETENPYLWTEKKLCSSCHQFNNGFIHADGELVVMGGDSAMYPPRYFERMWELYQQGYFVSSGFGSDITYVPELGQGPDNQPGQARNLSDYCLDQMRSSPLREEVMQSISEWYTSLGFKGLVIMDHRYRQLFENTKKVAAKITPQWYYGYSSLTLETGLKANGFDETFDPDVTLADIDFGYRVALAAPDYTMAMFRDVFGIECYARDWHNKMKRGVEVKCTYALLKRHQEKKTVRANESIASTEIDWMKEHVCWPNGSCDVQKVCREQCTHRAPFYNKNEAELTKLWDEQRRKTVDLGFERELRISGDSHTEGTFI